MGASSSFSICPTSPLPRVDDDDDPTAEASVTTTIVLFSAILPAISPKYDTSSRDKHPGLVGVAFRGAGEGGCRCHRHHHPSLRGGQQRPCLLVRLRLRTTARTTAAVTDGTTASGHCGRRCKVANDDADGETGRKPQQQWQRQWRRWQWQSRHLALSVLHLLRTNTKKYQLLSQSHPRLVKMCFLANDV